VLVLFASTGRAQEPAAGAREAIAVDAGLEVVSAYVFRGVRQNSTGVATWPSVNLGIAAYSGDGPLKRIVAGVGFWNSLQNGDTGSSGPVGKAWYESRVAGSVAFELGSRVVVGASYTAYTSPNDLFSTVKEIGLNVALHDDLTRSVAFNPHALVSFEVGAAPGVGQLDGGLHAGRYIELGATPRYSMRRATVTIPVRVGLSLGDYYELAGRDHTFGFVGVGALVTAPIGRRSTIGEWNVHGGVEIQAFGETTKVFNGGDRSKVIASFGVGLRR